MRKLLLCLTLLLFLCGAGYTQAYLEKTSLLLMQDLRRTTAAIEQQAWEEAVLHADAFEAEWQTHLPLWECLMPHESTENLTAAAEKLGLLLAIRWQEGALSAASEIRSLIAELSARHTLSPENLL